MLSAHCRAALRDHAAAHSQACQDRELVLLPQGSAVVTPAAGNLNTSWIIHAIAPDGLYGGDSPEANESMLRTTFESVMSAAEKVGARSLACCAIGCGVSGFQPAVAARATFEVAASWLEGDGAGDAASPALRELTFVIYADDVWRIWPSVAEKRLGPPDMVRDDESEQQTRTFEWKAHGDMHGEATTCTHAHAHSRWLSPTPGASPLST